MLDISFSKKWRSLILSLLCCRCFIYSPSGWSASHTIIPKIWTTFYTDEGRQLRPIKGAKTVNQFHSCVKTSHPTQHAQFLIASRHLHVSILSQVHILLINCITRYTHLTSKAADVYSLAQFSPFFFSLWFFIWLWACLVILLSAYKLWS